MPIRLANNASARLAASLSNTDLTAVLVMDDIQNFPALATGEWHPLTIVGSSGVSEVVKVTARASNLLTIQRAQEGTTARNFDAGSRVEIRITAGVFDAVQDQMRDELQDTADALDAARIALRDDLRGELAAGLATTQSTIEANTAANLAVALGALIPTGFGPVAWSGPDEPAGWIFADGRTLTAGVYPALRSYYIGKSFPHGQDGSGNPKIPDRRGRTGAGIDGGAGRLTGATLGAALGAQTHTLSAAELAAHSHTGSTAGAGSHAHGGSTDTEADHAHTASTATGGSHSHTVASVVAHPSNTFAGQVQAGTWTGTVTSSTHAGHTHSVTVNAGGSHAHAVTTDTTAAHTHAVTVDAAGSSAAHNNVQPTLVTNYLIKT